MKNFLIRYGYIFCIIVIAAILVINYIVLMNSVTKSAFAPGTFSGLTVVIDAGHGGEDGGAVSLTGTAEKHINLSIALKAEQLMALCGISPVMTRTTDEIVYPENANTTRARKSADTHMRAELVNSLSNAVFISIHQNTYGSNTSPHGAQVFFADTKGSEEFAESMQNTLRMSLDNSNMRKSVKIADNVYIMNHITCPAILIECGFLSNSSESRLLDSDSYQTKLAAAVTAGFLNSAQSLADIYWGGTNEA